MKKEVFASFSELRSTSERMFRLVQKILAGPEPINLRTSINEDLGILGLDWDTFLEEYENEFKTKLHGFKYTDYFDEEVFSMKDLLLFPIRLLWLLLIFLPARFLGIERKKVIGNKDVPPLTVGDLVLSAITGEFVKREQTVIKIKKHDA